MYTETVREFTTACHDGLPDRPTSLSPDSVAFIRRMVSDEMEELAEAESSVDQADALVDAIYYICDCAVRHGMNLDPLFSIVHQANMGKVVNGKVVRREDGKILKPEGWAPPEPRIHAEMQRQARDGSFS